MNISKEAKVTVFELKESEKRKNTMLANISSYEGKKEDDSAKYSSWKAHFVGKAYDAAKKLSDKDQIILTNAKIENNYNKEKEQLFIWVTIFDFKKTERER